MKRYLAMLIVFAFATTIVCAESKATSEATDMTLKGKLEKKEVTGGDKTKVTYDLNTTDYSKVELPKTDIKLDELVGQDVEMVVKAVVKADKKHVKVTEIVSVKKAEAAKATEAPAAAPATTTPPVPAK